MFIGDYLFMSHAKYLHSIIYSIELKIKNFNRKKPFKAHQRTSLELFKKNSKPLQSIASTLSIIIDIIFYFAKLHRFHKVFI